MNKTAISLLILIFTSTLALSQGFSVKAKGMKTFSFEDKTGRNQASFLSQAPLEDIKGLTGMVKGSASFDVENLPGTLKGKITIPVSSIKTGIELRDEHLREEGWLDAKNNPDIIFEIKSVKNVTKTGDNKLSADLVGNFTLKGVTKEVTAKTELTYLDENEKTKKRAPGDLLGVRSEFRIKLSDFNVSSPVIGDKVANEVEISVNIVGSAG